MTQQLTNRQIDDRQKGIQAHDSHQVFINNHNRMLSINPNPNQTILPTAKPLSNNLYSGKLYAGKKNGNTPSGAARLKRTAKKRNIAKARVSKR